MATQSEQAGAIGGVPVGDHRRLHDLLIELRHRAGDPSLRKINGVSGVSVGYLSQIFAGKTAPGPDVAVRVARALKATDREQARVRFYAEGTGADRSAQRTADPGRGRRQGWDGCPYLGLRPFEEQHAAIFYGRRAMTGRLLDRLREHPRDAGVLLVLGPSGAGKSSLLRAGLMGALADDGLAPGSQFWPRRVITPTGDPVRQLAIHLADLAAADAISVHETLTARPDQAYLLAGQALTVAGQPRGRAADGAAGGGPRLILVVDQLEELFTLTTDPAEQRTFLEALHSLATEPVLPGGEPGVLVVAGIRGDFLDQALAFTPVRQAAEAGVFAVGAMSESELREAVVGPAAEAGVRIPDDLCAAILDDLRERSLPVGFDSGALPLLSQVMFVMWQARDSAGLTVAGYHRTGGVAGIVRTSAEQVYETLSPARQDLARCAFTYLTAITDGRLTRRPSTRGALRTATGSDETDSVVEAFAAQRLLTVSDSDLVTISHEELLRSWNRLRDWLQPSLTDQALHQALTDDVHDWRQRRRDPSYLYQGSRLLAVDDALQRWAGDPAQHFPVDPATTEFLNASRHRARRRRRAYQAVGVMMVLLLVVTGASAVQANLNADRARVNAAQAVVQHDRAVSLLLSGLSRTTVAENRITAERFAAAALGISRTSDALAAAGLLLPDTPHILPGADGIVLFSEDGRTLATTDGDGKVRLWDPATGNLVAGPLTGHTRRVRSADFSPDGKLLATAGDDATVRLWDVATGNPAAVLSGHTGPARSVDFSTDGTSLATGGDDATVRLWDVASGNPAGVLDGHAGPVRWVRFGPDGSRLASFGDDRTARLWDPAARSLVGKPLAHAGTIYALGFSADGKLLISTDGGAVKLWNPVTGRPMGELAGHIGPVYATQLTMDGKLLATAGEDRTVRLWDLATRRPAGTLTGHTGPVRSMRFTTDGKLLATAGDDKTVRLWDPAARRPAGVLSGHPERVWAVRFSPDGKLLVTAGADRTVRLWDPATLGPAGAAPPGHTGPVNALAFSADGKLLATASTDSTARWWDPAARRAVGGLLTGHDAPVRAVAFSPGGTLLATAGDDAAVRLWDPATRRSAGAPLTGHTGPVRAVAFNPGGTLLVTAGDDAAVRLWDPVTRRLLDTLTGHAGPVRAVEFSPDGRLLATAGADATLRLWDPAAGRLVAGPFTGHTGPVYDVTFSPDGKTLASAGDDGTARLWNSADGKSAGAPLSGHSGPVWAARFSPDGGSLATSGDDRTVRLWDPVAGTAVGAPMTGHTAPVYDVAWSPDGKLVTVGGDTTLRWWDPSVFRRDPMAQLCSRVGGLTESEWRAHVPDEPIVKVCDA